MANEWTRWDGTLEQLLDREIEVRNAEQLVSRARASYLLGDAVDELVRSVLSAGGITDERIAQYLAAWGTAARIPTRQQRRPGSQPGTRPARQPRGSPQPLQAPSVLPAFPEALPPALLPQAIPPATRQSVQLDDEFPPFGRRG